MMIDRIKRFLIESHLSDWRKHMVDLEPGYTIVLPSPMDIPFLLRLGLEGIRCVDTTHCRQIIVVPDGWGSDGGASLKAVVAEFDDPRIEYVDLSRREYRLIRSMRPPGCAATHWMLVVNGTRPARCEYAFLHDADAFFLDAGGIERQYREAVERRMYTLGVTPRWDHFFVDLNYKIPGTWELMYSVRWARSRKPYELKGRRVKTQHGVHQFDSMLYPQYLDYESGRIGVMDEPPEFVHFNGTVFSYRLYRDAGQVQIVDELFRVLLLSLIQSALGGKGADGGSLPSVAELSRGLDDPGALVSYRSEVNRRGYPEFRQMVETMCAAPVFRGARSKSIQQDLRVFDDHFEYDPAGGVLPALSPGDTRIAGIRGPKKG